MMKAFCAYMYLIVGAFVFIGGMPIEYSEEPMWFSHSWGQTVGVTLLWPLFALKYVLIGFWMLLTALASGFNLLFS